ncbi:MAG: hypothetical protein AVDCRST_MAG41-1383 [uncultured Corynebacteriales bacterium]|uniref:Phage holin family protein n=1 Tax=uncultured Mycobacteriales bacterium TaxID=581187 RepID=A0A6J4I560_9ACTN|nr:MAG: hypothetical protein AVDCRST_MAG41-1383 [uncultured Corynebacteriales bacterium]
MSTAQSPDDQPSVGELVRQASEHVSTLVRAEVELAKAELSDTVKRGGIGGGLLAAAGVIALFSVPFLFVVLAEVLVAIGLWRWLSYLIVWVLFLLVAGVLALIGRSQLKKVRKPERTLETVKDTAAWARHPTSA